MDNKRLSFRLNAFHATNTLIIIVLLLAINYFAVKRLLFVEVEKNLATSCKFLFNQLQEHKNEIEYSAQRIRIYFKDQNHYQNPSPNITQLKAANKDVDKVLIVEKDGESFKVISTFEDTSKNDGESIDSTEIINFLRGNQTQIWIETTNNRKYSLHYLSKISEDKLLVVVFNNSSIRSYFSDFDLDKGGFPIVFNSAHQIIFHPLMNTHYYEEIGQIPQTVLGKIPGEFYSRKLYNQKSGVTIRKINLHTDRESYISYLLYEPNWNWYITVNQPYSQVYSDLFRYMKSIVLWSVLALLLMVYLIMVTNHFQTKPLKDIVVYLINSKYLQLKASNKENEFSLIRRGIDLLQNQLDQDAKSLERSNVNNKKIERDLELAKRLQRNILPAATAALQDKKEFDIYAISDSAFDIGGDLFDYYMLDKDHVLFAVGDVSGKGIQASLFMIFTQTLLRSNVRPGMPVAQIVEKLNNKLIEEKISDLFVTLFLGILNIRTGKLSYCNAGHCVPVYVHAHGHLEDLNTIHGIPIGIYSGKQYASSEIEMKKGDMIIVYTDGVVDAKDENGLKFSEDVLRYNLMGSWFSTAKETVNKVNENIKGFMGNTNPEDDLTILALKYTFGAEEKPE
jgi:sigma-B regulation protein RsbU (phosphoserine phosphatase)